MDGPDRRHPGDVDATLRRAVPVWAGPMARVVAIALLDVGPDPGGIGDRRYRVTTRIGLDEPQDWLVVARRLSAEALAALASAGLPGIGRPVPGDPDADGSGWVAFLEPPAIS